MKHVGNDVSRSHPQRFLRLALWSSKPLGPFILKSSWGEKKNVKFAKWVGRVKVERKQRNKYDLETMVCVFVWVLQICEKPGLQNMSMKTLREQREARSPLHKLQLETLTSRGHTCQETCFTAQKNCSETLDKFHSMSHIDSRKPGEKMHSYIFDTFNSPFIKIVIV